MGIHYESVGGIGFVVSATDKVKEILEKEYDGDLMWYLEDLTEEKDFYPIYFQSSDSSYFEYGLVYYKTFKNLAKYAEEYEQELLHFIKKHNLNLESDEIDMIFGFNQI